ncbi:MAG: hypothetical protein RIC16_09745 [Rhodospirillales bacterium]
MTGARIPTAGAFAVFALIAVVQAVWWLGHDTIVFADGDSFLRLIRVERLVETGDWFDVLIPRANAPYGFELHWTRPLDCLIILLALPAVPFLGWHGAILFAGEWIGPALHVATAAVMLWALVPLLGRVGACIAAGLTATQIAFLSFAVVGRADHHLLFALLLVAVIGCLIRAYEHNWPMQASRAGLALAAGVWVGPEFLLFAGIVVAVTGLRWLAGRPAAVELNRGLSIGFAVGLAGALLIERGGGVLEIEYDRLSLFHVAVGAMVAGFWAVVQGAGAHSRTGLAGRLAAAAAGAGVMAAVVVIVFPGALGYPFVEVDPAFLHVQQFIKDYEGVNSLRDVLLFLGPVAFALPWAVFRTFGRTHQWTWLVLAVSLVVYTVLSVVWLRWSLYPTVLAVIVLADVLLKTDAWVSARMAFPQRTLVKVPVILFIVLGPVAIAMAAKETEPVDEVSCPVKDLSAWLADLPAPATIAAPANFGPEILYRTGHRVLATLSHRNEAGVLDGYRLMVGDDLAAAAKIVADRHIEYIVACPDAGAESYIRASLVPGSLYTQLLAGNTPDGIEPVMLPADLARHFRVYRVDPDMMGGRAS